MLLPGEPERTLAAQRAEDGIDVAASTWEKIAWEAASLGVAV